MVRSRLPVPTLFCLFGPLLVLSSELLLWLPEGLLDLPLTHPGVKDAIAFATQIYNKRRANSVNYFKVLRVLKAQSQVGTRDEYHLMVELVETTCKKNSWNLMSMLFQNCEQLLGNDKKQTCYFKVILRSPQNLAVTACT